AAADVTTFSAGWSATNAGAHKPRLYMQGNRVSLVGAVTAGSGAGLPLLTVPTAFRPPTTSTRFIGPTVASGGNTGQLGLSNGVVSMISGYGNLNASSGTVIPLNCTWLMD